MRFHPFLTALLLLLVYVTSDGRVAAMEGRPSRQYLPLITSQLGPFHAANQFGYLLRDNMGASEPAFAWVDISGTAIEVLPTDWYDPGGSWG